MKTIEINLLPPEYVPPSPYSFRNIAIFVISLLTAIFLTVVAVRAISLKNRYDREYKQLMRSITAYGKQKQQINKLREWEAALSQRRTMLAELIGHQFTWSDKLIDLYEQIPENLWLSSISSERIEASKTTSEKGKKGESSQGEGKNGRLLILLHISGEALELQQISEFIARLDESPYFEKTKLLSIGRTEGEGRPLMSFRITTQLTR